MIHRQSSAADDEHHDEANRERTAYGARDAREDV
jgi:hypothetical protein